MLMQYVQDEMIKEDMYIFKAETRESNFKMQKVYMGNPRGHREDSESIIEAASHELFEETGAKMFKLTPVCIYSVERNEKINYTESFGQLFYAEIDEVEELPEFETEEIKLFKDISKELTYPLIQPFLHEKVLEFISK